MSLKRMEKRLKCLSTYEQIKFDIWTVCMTLHGVQNGSHEPIPKDQERRFIKFLTTCLSTWEPGSLHHAFFDNAVKNLILATLHEWKVRV